MENLLSVSVTQTSMLKDTKRSFLSHVMLSSLWSFLFRSQDCPQTRQAEREVRTSTLLVVSSPAVSLGLLYSFSKRLSHHSAKRRNADIWAWGAFVYRLTKLSFSWYPSELHHIASLFTSHSAPCLGNKLRHSENRKGAAKGCFTTIINVVKGS